jgi:hypothetical protein
MDTQILSIDNTPHCMRDVAPYQRFIFYDLTNSDSLSPERLFSEEVFVEPVDPEQISSRKSHECG